MARYLVEITPECTFTVCGIDSSEENIRHAREQKSTVRGSDRLDFLCGSLFEAPPSRLGAPLAAITAHSFVDEFPPQRLLQCFSSLLAPRGLVYASLTYNGRTAFWPQASEPEFEAELLLTYDRSMDERTFEGAPIAGSKGAQRFLSAAVPAGFEILCFGGSDWCIQPETGGLYSGDDATLLAGMVDFVSNEALKHAHLDATRTETWRSERRAQIERGELRLLVHHVDALLEKR